MEKEKIGIHRACDKRRNRKYHINCQNEDGGEAPEEKTQHQMEGHCQKVLKAWNIRNGPLRGRTGQGQGKNFTRQ